MFFKLAAHTNDPVPYHEGLGSPQANLEKVGFALLANNTRFNFLERGPGFIQAHVETALQVFQHHARETFSSDPAEASAKNMHDWFVSYLDCYGNVYELLDRNRENCIQDAAASLFAYAEQDHERFINRLFEVYQLFVTSDLNDELLQPRLAELFTKIQSMLANTPATAPSAEIHLSSLIDVLLQQGQEKKLTTQTVINTVASLDIYAEQYFKDQEQLNAHHSLFTVLLKKQALRYPELVKDIFQKINFSKITDYSLPTTTSSTKLYELLKIHNVKFEDLLNDTGAIRFRTISQKSFLKYLIPSTVLSGLTISIPGLFTAVNTIVGGLLPFSAIPAVLFLTFMSVYLFALTFTQSTSGKTPENIVKMIEKFSTPESFINTLLEDPYKSPAIEKNGIMQFKYLNAWAQVQKQVILEQTLQQLSRLKKRNAKYDYTHLYMDVQNANDQYHRLFSANLYPVSENDLDLWFLDIKTKLQKKLIRKLGIDTAINAAAFENVISKLLADLKEIELKASTYLKKIKQSW